MPSPRSEEQRHDAAALGSRGSSSDAPVPRDVSAGGSDRPGGERRDGSHPQPSAAAASVIPLGIGAAAVVQRRGARVERPAVLGADRRAAAAAAVGGGGGSHSSSPALSLLSPGLAMAARTLSGTPSALEMMRSNEVELVDDVDVPKNSRHMKRRLTKIVDGVDICPCTKSRTDAIEITLSRGVHQFLIW